MKRTITLLLAIVVVMIASVPLQAQMFYKGLGTTNSTFLLSNMLAQHNQCLYLPSDLTPAPQAGSIVRIYYRYGTTGIENGTTLGDLRIRMGQTTQTAFVGGDEYFTGLEMVLHEPTYTIAPGNEGEWFPITLETPFTYDPQQTLIIDIMFASSTTTNLGFMSTANNGRKLRSPDTTSTTGYTTSTGWQDMGFDLEIGTGIVHVSNEQSAVLPNPFAERTELLLGRPLKVEAQLEVIDMTGRTVFRMQVTAGRQRIPIDLGDAPPGLYFAHLRGHDGFVQVSRLLKE